MIYIYISKLYDPVDSLLANQWTLLLQPVDSSLTGSFSFASSKPTFRDADSGDATRQVRTTEPMGCFNKCYVLYPSIITNLGMQQYNKGSRCVLWSIRGTWDSQEK